MMERRIFRPEAIDAHARGREDTPADLLIGRRWIRWSYWVILVAVALGGLAASRIGTNETVTGPAVLQAHGRTFSALLPAVAAPDLGSAESLVLEVPGPGPSKLSVARARLRPATPAAVKAAGLSVGAGQSVLLVGTTVRNDARRLGSRSGGVHGRLLVVLRKETLAELMARQVRRIVGASN
jgi:hypothetical protein